MATILVVDDLAANREVLVSLLRYKGHRLIEAASGEQGLAMARAERPDLVITDVLMPEMDGYGLVRALRLDPATSAIPVVFYTAHFAAREARELALSVGVAHVLTKPVEPEEVLRIVGQLLSGASTAVEHVAPPETFDRDHLRLVTDMLSERTSDLKAANTRLRALINIGLDLASESNADQLLQNVCASARELFSAAYVTLGIIARENRTLQRFVTTDADRPPWIALADDIPGILHTVVEQRRVIRGVNEGGDPAALLLPRTHPPIRAYLAAPIASPAHVYGWICLVANEQWAFSAEDEDLVAALAGQIGRIYENGYFYKVAREERDRAQRYLDTADVILLSLDVNGRVTLVNRHACDVLGRTHDDLIGREFIAACLPAHAHAAARQRLKDIQAGAGSFGEGMILTRSGEERLIEWRTTIIRDDNGQITGTLSSGTDVTERRRASAALLEAEERMRFSLESANIGIWDMDYVTQTLVWSEIAQSHYGLAAGEFEGTFQSFIDRVHPDDRAVLLETIGRATKTGGRFSTENRALWPDGTVRWLRGLGHVFHNANGEPIRATGISMDVTERRQLESQYMQAQKMEAVGRLAGGVAHDFNNLLIVILGRIELLLADLEPGDPRRSDLAVIQKAGDSAANLTKQLLAFSRKQIIEPTLLDLNVVVSEMRTMLGRLIGEDIKVLLGLRPTSAPVVADRGQIEQIVMNLAVNARDAMPKGGTLTIETASVELDDHYAKTHLSAKPGHYIALSVSDTGTGMPPEVQARLFEPFFTTKEIGKGTGLGLATVHGIATHAGGSVNVYSEVGRGTTFKVYFPRVDAAETAAPPATLAAPERPAGGAHTILVVEDAADIRDLVGLFLERLGYVPVLAANVDEALELFDKHPAIDVLLTDVVMPGGSGPDLTIRLRERRPKLRVIYMSGYTEDAIVHHGVLQPGIAFLPKPFTSDMMRRKIREVLEG